MWVKSASFVFNAYGWRRFMFRRFMFMDGERIMVMDDGDGELCFNFMVPWASIHGCAMSYIFL